MLFIKYNEIYKNITGEKFSLKFSLCTAVFFSFMLSILLFLLDDFSVLRFFPLIVFLINLIAIFIDESEKGNMVHLFSLLSITPIKKTKIMIYNYLCKFFSNDQLIFYLFLSIVLVIFKIKPNEFFAFYVRIFILLFIVQSIEYAYLVYKKRFVQQFIFPILILILSLFLSKGKHYFSVLSLFENNNFDVIIVLAFVLSFIASPFIVEKLLVINKKNVPLSAILFSNYFSRIGKFLPCNSNVKVIIETQLKIYLRDSEILYKYMITISLVVAYSTIGHIIQAESGKYNLITMAYLIGIYFFSEIKIPLILEKRSLFQLMPITQEKERFIIDLCGFLLFMFFGILGLTYRALLLNLIFVDLYKSYLFLSFSFLISVHFKQDKERNDKLNNLKLFAKYGIINLLGVMFFVRLNMYILILLNSFILMFTYIRIYRKVDIKQ